MGNILDSQEVIILSPKATLRVVLEQNSVFQRVRIERIKTRILLKKLIFGPVFMISRKVDVLL